MIVLIVGAQSCLIVLPIVRSGWSEGYGNACTVRDCTCKKWTARLAYGVVLPHQRITKINAMSRPVCLQVQVLRMVFRKSDTGFTVRRVGNVDVTTGNPAASSWL